MSNETSATSYRLFIAIVVPDAVKDEIEKAQSEMRRGLPANCVRWTKREQFHLTLSFLGQVQTTQIDALTGALRGACEGFPALHLRAVRIGFFPDARFPRVIWTSVLDERGGLLRLQSSIANAVRDFSGGERGEENFTGHVTVGRARKIGRAEADMLGKLAAGMTDRSFGEWTADRVELVRSELSSNGSKHSILAAMPLGSEVPPGKPAI